MSLDRKVGIIVQVLAGLAHAHQQGIVHRDIKPANVFINQDGTVKIMDFGVARLTTGSMTGTGNIVGTADYMSPEQVKGAKVDGRSDLFSVGCMLYELLTGRRPFHSENLMAIFYKITHEEPNFDLVPEGAEYDALMPILKKSLAKELEDRHQTAYEFAMELREHLKANATTRDRRARPRGPARHGAAGRPHARALHRRSRRDGRLRQRDGARPRSRSGRRSSSRERRRADGPDSSARTAVPGTKAIARRRSSPPEPRPARRGAARGPPAPPRSRARRRRRPAARSSTSWWARWAWRSSAPRPSSP